MLKFSVAFDIIALSLSTGKLQRYGLNHKVSHGDLVVEALPIREQTESLFNGS